MQYNRFGIVRLHQLWFARAPVDDLGPECYHAAMFRIAIPILHASSARQAEAFYCDKLGFRKYSEYRPKEDSEDPCYMTFIREGTWVHVSSFPGDGVVGTAVYLIVDNVDKLFKELTSREVTIDMEPTTQSWGTREMYIRDPFGNQIRFTQEPLST